MNKISFNKLGYKMQPSSTNTFKVNNELNIEVLQYLPAQEKGNLISFVASNAIDDKTGCFSPLRIEVFFNLALAKWYGGVSFTDKQIREAWKTYDILETNGFFENLRIAMDAKEFTDIQDMLDETLQDIARYNNSFAGMLNIMSGDAEGLNNQITTIMEQIKNKEGLEQLSAIKDMVGKD